MDNPFLMFLIPALVIVMSAVKQSFFARREVLRVLRECQLYYKANHSNKEGLFAQELVDRCGFSVSRRNIHLVLGRLMKDGLVTLHYQDCSSVRFRARNIYKLAP